MDVSEGGKARIRGRGRTRLDNSAIVNDHDSIAGDRDWTHGSAVMATGCSENKLTN